MGLPFFLALNHSRRLLTTLSLVRLSAFPPFRPSALPPDYLKPITSNLPQPSSAAEASIKRRQQPSPAAEASNKRRHQPLLTPC